MTGSPITLGAWLRTPVPRIARFLAINFGIAFGLWAAIIDPLLQLVAARNDMIAEERTTAGRYALLIARANAGPREGSGQDDLSGAKGFFDGNDGGVLDARLQSQVKRYVAEAGARLLSTRTIAQKSRLGLRFAGAGIDVAGTIGSIQATLRAIEDAKPYLFIDSAEFTGGATGYGTEKADAADIQARIEVYSALEPGS